MLKVFYPLVVRLLIVISTEETVVLVNGTVVTSYVWVSPFKVVLLAVDQLGVLYS